MPSIPSFPLFPVAIPGYLGERFPTQKRPKNVLNVRCLKGLIFTRQQLCQRLLFGACDASIHPSILSRKAQHGR